jgi:N-acetyl-D-muramate 6-phosphate phosphatase
MKRGMVGNHFPFFLSLNFIQNQDKIRFLVSHLKKIMLDKTKIKAIIFDIDGTLRDTDDEMVRRIELFLLHFEFFMSTEKAKTAARHFVMDIEDPGQKVLYYSDKWGWDTLIHKIIVFLRKLLKPFKHPKNYLTIEGIKEMIPQLAQHYTLAVASAGDEETVNAFLENAGIRQYFKAIATALTCSHTKPFADPLIWAAYQMGVSPEQCVMVGDTTVDISAGKNAGTQTVAVLCGFGEKSELEALKPDLMLETTGMLKAILVG